MHINVLLHFCWLIVVSISTTKLYQVVSVFVERVQTEVSRDIYLSPYFAYVGKYHADKCLVLDACRDKSQDIYILALQHNNKSYQFIPLIASDIMNSHHLKQLLICYVMFQIKQYFNC